MKPLITIKKSMWSIAWTFVWTILLSPLIVPVIYLITRIITIKKNYLEVYEDRIIEYKGVFNISKTERTFTKVLGVNTHKTFFGNMMGYGDLAVNLIGSNNISFTDVKNVDEVESFFRNRIVDSNSIKQSIME